MVYTGEKLRTIVPKRVFLVIHIIVLRPPPRTQGFAGTITSARGGLPASYLSLDCATEVHMASSFQADQTPIRDIPSLSAQSMSASSPALPSLSQTGLVLQCYERLTTSTTAGNMNIWHTGNEHKTPSTSHSPLT